MPLAFCDCQLSEKLRQSVRRIQCLHSPFLRSLRWRRVCDVLAPCFNQYAPSIEVSDFLRELLSVFVASVAVAFGQVFITAGYPGVWLTEFYLRLFRRALPPSLELGGLFIALVLSFAYPFGAIWGYALGFWLAPMLSDLPSAAKWIIGIIVFFLWTLLMFELGYRWAIYEDQKRRLRS